MLSNGLMQLESVQERARGEKLSFNPVSTTILTFTENERNRDCLNHA